MKSIDAAVTPNYNRIRIGVGHPDRRGEAVVNHVLSGFSKADGDVIKKEIDLVADTIPILLKKGVSEYSNKLGLALNFKA